MLTEKYFRKISYLALQYRDGYKGITTYKRQFKNFSTWNFENIQEYSFQRLKKILVHAYTMSPYYQELWKKIDIDPKAINNFQDIDTLPLLTKDIIEKNKEKMISRNFGIADLEISYTGGSSGTHTSFYRDRNCSAMRMGRQWGILEACGYYPGDRCGLIWGVHEDLPDPKEKASLKRNFRKFASGKETLSCTIMNPEKMREFHTRLLRFNPKVLYGYPNAIAEFATFIKEKNLHPITVKRVICTAERLTENQRQLFSEVFGGEVFNLYCTREHGCIGYECGKHHGFHLDIGSVYVEIISNDHLAPPGVSGEIVITDLLNYGMPFIRNKIGDRGSLSSKLCDCGCQLPRLSKFDGRETDMLYRSDGSTVAGVMLVDMFLDVAAIKALQIVQENLTEIDLFLVVTDEYNKRIEQRVIKEMKDFMGQETKINVKILPEIPRNPLSGKYQEVICKLKPR